MQKSLDIIWRHSSDIHESVVAGADTQRTLPQILQEIEQPLAAAGIDLRYTEELVPGENGPVDEVLLDGRPFLEVYARVKDSHDYCHARSHREERCCHLLGEEDPSSQEMTEFLIRKTILFALEKE